jgi:chromosome segregation ATPase
MEATDTAELLRESVDKLTEAISADAGRSDSLSAQIESISDSIDSLAQTLANNAQLQTILLGVIAVGVVGTAIALIIIAIRRNSK